MNDYTTYLLWKAIKEYASDPTSAWLADQVEKAAMEMIETERRQIRRMREEILDLKSIIENGPHAEKLEAARRLVQENGMLRAKVASLEDERDRALGRAL